MSMDNIISSFEPKNKLNPDVWVEAGGFTKINPEVRMKILQVAQEFIESFKVEDLDIEDVLLVGSLANYNWSRYSDVDLHILIDQSKIPGDPTLVDEFFDAKKQVFNSAHDIEIKGFAVEVYVQDVTERLDSGGVYSVLYNKWVKQPSAEEVEVDKKAIGNKVKEFTRHLKAAKSMKDDNKKIEKINQLRDKIKKYRKAGLEAHGEFGVENLVFKYLRRCGYMEELSDLKVETLDAMLSLQEGKNPSLLTKL